MSAMSQSEHAPDATVQLFDGAEPVTGLDGIIEFVTLVTSSIQNYGEVFTRRWWSRYCSI
jgi:hypothetical protein